MGLNCETPIETEKERVDSFLAKQARYKDEGGEDWIDEFAKTKTPTEFRAAMQFTIGKYVRRLGKKDSVSSELYKIGDYYLRLAAYEKELENKK